MFSNKKNDNYRFKEKHHPRHVNIVPKYRKKTVGGNCYAMVDICGHVHHLGRYNSKASHIEYDRLIAEWLACKQPPRPGNTTVCVREEPTADD